MIDIDTFDEQPTVPDASIADVQRELDSSESVVGFMARARSLGYGGQPEPLPDWIVRLDAHLESLPIVEVEELQG